MMTRNDMSGFYNITNALYCKQYKGVNRKCHLQAFFDAKHGIFDA
jgi:hypothetical protein